MDIKDHHFIIVREPRGKYGAYWYTLCYMETDNIFRVVSRTKTMPVIPGASLKYGRRIALFKRHNEYLICRKSTGKKGHYNLDGELLNPSWAGMVCHE